MKKLSFVKLNYTNKSRHQFIYIAQNVYQSTKIRLYFTIAPLRFKNSEPKIFSVRTGEI